MENPIYIFVASYVISSVCGLAIILRSDELLTLRAVLAAILYNGMLGLSVSLVAYRWVEEAWLTIGLSMLVGLSGMKAADILVILSKKAGIAIKALSENGK